MESLKTFFAILFLSESVLLTPELVRVDGAPLEIVLEESISAVTPGAHLIVDVSGVLPRRDGEDAYDWADRTETFFEGANISVMLFDFEDFVTLAWQGGANSRGDENQMLLSLYAKGGMPVGSVYHRLILSSDVPLEGIRVTWRNFSL